MIKTLDKIRKILFIVATVLFGAAMITNAFEGAGSAVALAYGVVVLAFFVGAVLFLGTEGTAHKVGLGLFLGALVLSLTIGFELLETGSTFATLTLVSAIVYACSFIVEFIQFLCKKAVETKR